MSRPEVQNEARPEAEKEELVDEEERSGSNKERGAKAARQPMNTPLMSHTRGPFTFFQLLLQ